MTATCAVSPMAPTSSRRRAGVVAVCVCAAAAVGLSTRAVAQSAGPAAIGAHVGSVAVEVFTNVTGVQNDTWIGKGIAEAVAVDLGGTTDGESRSRWRVRGAYQRVADSLRITAELVDVAGGRTLNAVTVDGMMSDLSALQDELGRRLAGMLRVASTRDAGIPPGGERNGSRLRVAPWDGIRAATGHVGRPGHVRRTGHVRAPLSRACRRHGDASRRHRDGRPVAVSLPPTACYTVVRIQPYRVLLGVGPSAA